MNSQRPQLQTPRKRTPSCDVQQEVLCTTVWCIEWWKGGWLERGEALCRKRNWEVCGVGLGDGNRDKRKEIRKRERRKRGGIMEGNEGLEGWVLKKRKKERLEEEKEAGLTWSRLDIWIPSRGEWRLVCWFCVEWICESEMIERQEVDFEIRVKYDENDTLDDGKDKDEDEEEEGKKTF
ncbi:uncharacterized protein LY89DRAFT_722433 [Mollisia scopiformis]|uniref:Uncharacterized protein n=1 Tax=Mollisia scopiformis TaxID=149040 RepID=A0A194WVQ9_MOLSC|nr:uncharacterized protein LY89DRAFT_722433 [Mollisia scopiformis]KUJ12056.1 hypothetical protein LY89DRAFT_722433 [Mollisia scopiformis]